MTGPLPVLGAASVPYALVAFFMVLANLYIVLRILPKGGGTPHFGTVIIVVGLLVMSVSLWFAVIYAILSPGDASIVSVFIAGNSMMAVFGLWAIGLLYRAEERHPSSQGIAWPALFALMIVGSELLMGITFVLAQSGTSGYSAQGFDGLVALVSDAVASVWFLYAMMATMLVVVFWLGFPRAERRTLAAFSLTAIAAPWIVRAPLDGAIGTGVVMAAILGIILLELLGTSTASPGFVRLSIGICVALGVMTVGVLADVASPGSLGGPFAFALANLSVMGVELWFLIRLGFQGRLVESFPAEPQPTMAISPGGSSLPEL
ncbi:MAG: hypothetical protein ACHQ2Y_04085 [Candidatus Lutacidiplasmatales archaeon]